ncbi:MAG: DUF5805 domain-containing protein [Halobacteriaceae archaeon]
MSQDTSRTAVQTYVPAYQRETWRTDAEELDMSLSEFVRSMVQAGRRELSLDGGGEETGAEPRHPDANPRGQHLEARIHRVVSAESGLGPAELVDAVVDDLDREVRETVDAMDDVEFSSTAGGYVIADGE